MLLGLVVYKIVTRQRWSCTSLNLAEITWRRLQICKNIQINLSVIQFFHYFWIKFVNSMHSIVKSFLSKTQLKNIIINEDLQLSNMYFEWKLIVNYDENSIYRTFFSNNIFTKNCTEIMTYLIPLHCYSQ